MHVNGLVLLREHLISDSEGFEIIEDTSVTEGRSCRVDSTPEKHLLKLVRDQRSKINSLLGKRVLVLKNGQGGRYNASRCGDVSRVRSTTDCCSLQSILSVRYTSIFVRTFLVGFTSSTASPFAHPFPKKKYWKEASFICCFVGPEFCKGH